MAKRSAESTKQNMFSVGRSVKVPAHKEIDTTKKKTKKINDKQEDNVEIEAIPDAQPDDNTETFAESEEVTAAQNNEADETINEKPQTEKVKKSEYKKASGEGRGRHKEISTLDMLFADARKRGENVSIYFEEDVLNFINENAEKYHIKRSKFVNDLIKQYMYK